MEWNDLDRLRDPGFTVARRGYDRREVDKLLGSLVDWLEKDAATQLGDVTVKRKLELVGRSTTRILLTTEQESEQMLRRAEDECAELRSQAEAAALDTQRAAEAHARQVREKAEQEARRTTEAATTKARQIVEEGERRRAQIDAVIAELEARRDATVRELERLREELGSTIAEHGAGARPRKRTAARTGEPAQLVSSPPDRLEEEA